MRECDFLFLISSETETEVQGERSQVKRVFHSHVLTSVTQVTFRHTCIEYVAATGRECGFVSGKGPFHPGIYRTHHFQVVCALYGRSLHESAQFESQILVQLERVVPLALQNPLFPVERKVEKVVATVACVLFHRYPTGIPPRSDPERHRGHETYVLRVVPVHHLVNHGIFCNAFLVIKSSLSTNQT